MMGRIFPLGLIALTALTALSTRITSVAQEGKSEPTSALFPLKVGHRWTYRGNDGKERVVVAVEKQEPIRRKVKTPTGDKTETIETYYLRISSGDKSLQEQVFVADDGVYRFAAAGKDITPPLKFLSLPAKKGETWTVESESEAVKLRGSFAVDQEAITTPMGSFSAFTSSTRDFFLGDQKLEASYAFAPNVGIVRQHVKLGKFDLKLELEKFEPAGGTGAPPALTLPALPLPPVPVPVPK